VSGGAEERAVASAKKVGRFDSGAPAVLSSIA